MEFTPTPLPNKGYGNSTTISYDVCDSAAAKQVLLSLCESVGTRLHKDNVYATTVSISIKDYLLQSKSHQMKLLFPTNTPKELHNYACTLFEELWDNSPIRHLGVHTSDVVDESMRQMNLFDINKFEKQNILDHTIDDIRSRFGTDSVFRSSFLNNPFYHFVGGINKDKNGETEFNRGDDKCKNLFQ